MRSYPFDFEFSENSYKYFFGTENGLNYIINFKPSFWFPQGDTYEMSIENTSMLPNSAGFDTRIKETIISIIHSFFHQNPDFDERNYY
jgi:hypothetical protein